MRPGRVRAMMDGDGQLVLTPAGAPGGKEHRPMSTRGKGQAGVAVARWAVCSLLGVAAASAQAGAAERRTSGPSPGRAPARERQCRA